MAAMSGQPHATIGRLEQSARDFCGEIAGGTITTAGYTNLHRALVAALAFAPADDADTIASDAITELAIRIQRGEVPDKPGAYLYRSARNLWVTRSIAEQRHRRFATRSRPLGSDPIDLADSKLDSESEIADALDAACTAHDDIAIRVLGTAYNLAHDHEPLTHRNIAEHAQVSHTTVRAVFDQAAHYLNTRAWASRTTIERHQPPGPDSL